MKKHCLALMALLLFFSCKKYPENPLISFKTRTQRILGTWKMLNYFANSVDSLPLNAVYNCSVEFTTPKGFNPVVVSGNGVGTWFFDKHKSHITVDLNGGTSDKIFKKLGLWWEIRRLTNDDLWLKADYGLVHYEIKMQQ